MKTLILAALLPVLAAPSRAGKFDAEEIESVVPGLRLSGLLDVRATSSDLGVSWLRGGTNRLRTGGRDTNADGRPDRRVAGAALPQASVVVDAEVLPDVKVHVHANFTTDAASGTGKVGVIEAYAEWQRAFGEEAFRLRAGDFIPLLSWEHPDPAWSTRYTLTPSALGSWVGEEVRALGGELSWEHPVYSVLRLRLTGGVFSGGDQIGRTLWERGWSLGDTQGDLAVEYPLAGRRVRPLEEHDGRPGSYGRADLDFFDRLLRLGGGYWSNNGDERLGAAGFAAIDRQPFRTTLVHYGGKVEWKRLTLISQFSKTTVSGSGRPAKDWADAYVLASWQWRKARLSGRYERFWALNWENGFSWTAFAACDFSVRQQLGLEYLYASGRPSQAVRPRAQIDRLVSLNWRLRY